jgi:single-stranded DNA-binding protein
VTRYGPKGDVVCNFSVAVNHAKDAPPTWFRVAVWGALAEACQSRLSKGQPVLVVGRVGVSAWLDKQRNEARASLQLLAKSVTFLSESPTAWAPSELVEPVPEESEIPF